MIMQKIANAVRRFGKKEDGLVTVEWVSLAAAVTIGGMAICWAILDAIDTANVGGDIAAAQSDAVGSAPANPFSGGSGGTP